MLRTDQSIGRVAGGRRNRPTTVKERAPRIRMVTPGTSFKVSGSVFILIDAISDLDSKGDLNVEILIDGTTSISARYSEFSGYYGAIWDSMTVRAGTKHMIVAKATDSAGNSRSTLAAVTVE
jgi:hypothetical protein